MGNNALRGKGQHQSIARQRGFAGGAGNDGGEGADHQHPAIGQGFAFFGCGAVVRHAACQHFHHTALAAQDGAQQLCPPQDEPQHFFLQHSFGHLNFGHFHLQHFDLQQLLQLLQHEGWQQGAGAAQVGAQAGAQQAGAAHAGAQAAGAQQAGAAQLGAQA